MAPKKGHGAKPAAKGLGKPSDSDHIVFTNNPNGGKVKNDQEQQGPPRPDTRKIIGGASWTGKLPVNLLSEHCQREKWNKPDYSMRRVAGGAYRSSVALSKTDPKTRETTAISSFELPESHATLANQESALEARHFAATYALFRVASMKNIHMTLPPTYRDLWKGPFQELKKEDIKEKREWKYDADPFAADAKRKEIRVDIEKRKAEQEKKAAAAEKAGFETPQLHAQSDRLWSRAPRVELGQNLRSEIEGIVRRDAAWNQHESASPKANSNELVGELKKLGFRESHIREAAEYCSTVQEAIEWLLIHIPEDDLPKWALPQGYSAGISLASGDLVNDAKMKQLTRGGYSADLCAQALRDNNGNERAALEALQSSLVPPLTASTGADESNLEVWSEELMALEAIYGDNYKSSDSESCSVALEPVSGHLVTLHIGWPSGGYPASAVPLLAVDIPALPAYIRLSATRQTLNYAWESLLGDQMIYSLIEHIQSTLPSVIDNPGRLVDLEMQNTTFDLTKLQLGPSELTKRARKPPASNRRLYLDNRTNEEINAAWKARQGTPAQRKMNASRNALPAWNKRGAIVEAVTGRQVTLITGDTGSGKSTQSVQFIIDDAIEKGKGSTVNILCTQPRRVAALALSDRVAEERCSAEGEEVGYIIRGASKVSPTTKITFLTTGVLLRQLQLSKSPQEALKGISHVFIDEVHERSLDTDFLLALLKNALSKLPKLSLVLMSATVDPDTFIKYFGGNSRVGRVHIEGRTFPVTDYYLDDVLRLTGGTNVRPQTETDEEGELDVGKAIQSLGMGINHGFIASLVEMIDVELGADPGAILIFLPGVLDIDRCLRSIKQLDNMYAFPLHASLLPSEQKKVFPPAPKGLRKVICSTNVAETSVTIPDVVAVIDTGRVKETTYDVSSSIVRLQEVWASKAACKQRRGRAGRVQSGTCYKLFTRNVESSMRPLSDPEVKRVPLEQLCLSVKATTPNHDVADFLGNMMSPPDSSTVSKALGTLHRVGALENGLLTGLGTCMAMIPADLRCAKLIIYGTIFGCLEACLTIGAILTNKSPFVSPRDKRQEADEARRTFPRADGDLLLDRAAFDEWKEQSSDMTFREARSWTEARFLSHQTLRDIDSNRQQLLDALKEATLVATTYQSRTSFDQHPTLNTNNTNTQLLRALIAGALTPNLAEIKFPEKKYMQSMSGAKELDPEAKTIKYFSEDHSRLFSHPSSVLFDAQSYTGGAMYISYFTKMATSKTFVRELTPVNAYGVLLFGGKINVDTTGAGLVVDGWLRMRGWARIGVLVGRLRKLLDVELSRRIDEREDARGMNKEVVDVVRRLVELNGQDA